MPSPYTSRDSLEDAEACARAIGIRYDIVDIGPAMEAFRGMLTPLFGNRAEDVTEENIQSRARGVTLMAVSNKLGGMVVTTGNKSEMAVGYATLYGDMCGGYSVLKDVYKTTVFALSHWRNQNMPAGALGPQGRAIPERSITKPPSAELKPNQTDQDTLPEYDKLDDILDAVLFLAHPTRPVTVVASPEQLTARQLCNVKVALSMARREGIAWLLHIDADELFHPPKSDARAHFAHDRKTYFLDAQLDLAAMDSAILVDLVVVHLRRVDDVEAVGHRVARQRAEHADAHGLVGHAGLGLGLGQAGARRKGDEQDLVQSHGESPLRGWISRTGPRPPRWRPAFRIRGGERGRARPGSGHRRSAGPAR